MARRYTINGLFFRNIRRSTDGNPRWTHTCEVTPAQETLLLRSVKTGTCLFFHCTPGPHFYVVDNCRLIVVRTPQEEAELRQWIEQAMTEFQTWVEKQG